MESAVLVVCNGAAKSGSTWLYNIVLALIDAKKPAEHYLTNGNRINATIRPDSLRAFLESEDFRSSHYITKNHLAKPEHKSLLLSFDDVAVIDIARDVRDVTVSSYYDAINRAGLKGSFEKFYWSEGRKLADAITRYHELWTPDDEQVLRVSYEVLTDDFEAEVTRVARFLRVEISKERLVAVREQTSMDTLRQQYKDEQFYEAKKFFRKGIVGDWKNHFSELMIEDIARIEQGRPSLLDPRIVLNLLRARIGLMA